MKNTAPEKKEAFAKKPRVQKKHKPSLLIIGSRHYKRATVNSLLMEGKELFSSVLFVPIDRVQIQTSEGNAGLFYKGKNLLAFDAIYPRFSSKDFLLAEPILKAIESSSAYCPVSLRGYQISNNKFFTSQTLAEFSPLGVSSTLFISPKRAPVAVKETGYPFVMKLIAGFAGKGVVLVNNEAQMDSVLDTVHLFQEFISTQSFIKSKGVDVRCYVFGNYVLGVKRIGKKGEWRSNLSRGGTAKLINLSPEMVEMAKSSAKKLGMDICAVDLMKRKKHWGVIEVNFMPGPFMKFLGSMVVQQWLRFIAKKALKGKKKVSLSAQSGN